MKSLTFHSSRGGTGKSLLSVNTAAILVNRNKNVCLLDLDFRAPSLHVIFKATPEYWMNDFLNRESEIEDVLVDLSKQFGSKGKFLIGLADPSMLAIRDFTTKDRRWEMKALQRLLSLKDALANTKIDYLIFDTSPGIQYASVNAVVSSDYVIVVTTMDALDIQGTRLMIEDLYKSFEKKTGILFNKVPVPLGLPLSEVDKGKLAKQLQEAFNLPIVEMIPCYCDVLHTSRTVIFALEKPEHPFTKDVIRAVDHIERLLV